MSGLSTSYLWRVGERILPHFSGVVSCDHLVSNLLSHRMFTNISQLFYHFQDSAFPNFSRSRSTIVNALELRYREGGHWLALAYNVHQDRFHFWDPFGLDVELYPLVNKFLLQTGKSVTNYPIRIQSDESISCGFHSLAFLIHHDYGFDSKTFFNFYDKDHLKRNDDISVDFIKAAIIRM